MENLQRSRQKILDEMAANGKVTSRKSISSIADEGTLKRNHVLLKDIANEIPTAAINGFASLVNYAPTADQPIHRWFRYREGYSTALVTELIKTLPRGSTVLDPFCGAGTSLLAARALGLPSVGIDVNPISTLVSRVKTTNYNDRDKEILQEHISTLKRAKSAMKAEEKPALKIIDQVFHADVLHALLVFRKLIKSIKEEKLKNFLFVAWLSILEDVSNVYKEGNGLKYKNRKRTDDGYIRLNLKAWQDVMQPEDRFAFVKKTLLTKVAEMTQDLAHMPERGGEVTIIEDGAENLDKHLLPNSVAMSVFSPPYCNCFNYFKMYKVELWMGEFVKSYDDLKKLNRRGLRSHVETVLKRDTDKIEPFSEIFAKQLDGLKLWDRRIPNAVRGYFIDMAQVISNLHKVLKPHGKCVIVVGNSAYGGVVIPTDAILAQIAVSFGFKVEKLAVARELTTSSQQRSSLLDRKEFLRESLLILVKEDPRHAQQKDEVKVVEELPAGKKERQNSVFAIRNSGLTAMTHKFHRYPGKYIPHVPRWAIKTYLNDVKQPKILDPFCGSGTSLVEASIHGIESFGIDIDPIARLVTKVKTTPISPSKLERVVIDVKQKVSRKNKSKTRPEIPTLFHWFSKEAVNDLGVLKDVIDTYSGQRDIHDFLTICLAAIIRRVSNADNQTQKTYVSHTRIKVPEPVKPLFCSVLEDYSRRLIEFSRVKNLGNSHVLDVQDARDFARFWKSENLPKMDMIVTSPPYLNSVDYVYNQMAEYFWIGEQFKMQNQDLQNDHKKKYIGTDKVKARQYEWLPVTGIKEIDSIVEAVARKSKKNAYIVARYFIDMTEHFKNAAYVLKPDAPYICVVGDSVVSGEPILVHELLVKCAKIAGFKFCGEFAYEIRNRHMRFPRMGRGGIVPYDWILEFKRS